MCSTKYLVFFIQSQRVSQPRNNICATKPETIVINSLDRYTPCLVYGACNRKLKQIILKRLEFFFTIKENSIFILGQFLLLGANLHWRKINIKHFILLISRCQWTVTARWRNFCASRHKKMWLKVHRKFLSNYEKLKQVKKVIW